VTAEDRIMVNYTLIDENSVSLRDFTAVHESHFGLSNGMVAYHKGQTIYTWDSRTGERKILEIPPEPNYNTKIQALDITDGTVYYIFDKQKERRSHGNEGGMYAFDGKNNTLITPFSRHNLINLIVDNDLILIHDATNYHKPLNDPMTKISGAELLVYSTDRGDITSIDHLSDINDPSGFGGNTIITATYSISLDNPDEIFRRHPGDGLALFSLVGSLGNQSVTQISIPSGTNIGSSGGIVGFDPDCLSENYLVWIKTNGIRTPAYHSVLYLTDLRTLKNVILAETDGSFSDYLYAVDGDYLVYGRTLYHIPTGMTTELSFNGELDKLFDNGIGELFTSNTSELDIIRFNDGGLLIRTYPRVENADYSGKYQLWYADLGPIIHPGEKAREKISDKITASAQMGMTEKTPVSFLISGLALIVAGILILYGNRK
jgi:hypothetical protein